MSKKSSTQQRILDTASRLFYQQGFTSTGINQIIAEADIAIASLYKHYKSKNDLLYSYLELQDVAFFSNLNHFLKDEQTPKDRLLKLIDFRIALQQDTNCSGCHFLKINAELGRKDERVNELVAKHKKKQRSYLRDLIDQLTANTDNSSHSTLLANNIFLMIEGAVTSASIQGDTHDLKSVKDSIKALL